MTISDAILAVRREIDQIVHTGTNFDGSVDSDDDLWTSYASRFSDGDISDRLESAACYVVARSKAALSSSLRTDLLVGANESVLSFVRLIEESVVVAGRIPTRESTRSLRELKKSGRRPTATSPVYSFEDAFLSVAPAEVSDQLEAKALIIPVTDDSGHAVEKLDDDLATIAVARCAFLFALSLPTHTMAQEAAARHASTVASLLQGTMLESMQPPVKHKSQIASDAR